LVRSLMPVKSSTATARPDVAACPTMALLMMWF
jgi:hypothetical protein